MGRGDARFLQSSHNRSCGATKLEAVNMSEERVEATPRGRSRHVSPIVPSEGPPGAPCGNLALPRLLNLVMGELASLLMNDVCR